MPYASPSARSSYRRATTHAQSLAQVRRPRTKSRLSRKPRPHRRGYRTPLAFGGNPMPLFDRNKASGEITSEVIDDANAVVERLRALRVTQIVLPEPVTGLRVPNLVRCYLQAHLRRCLMFLEAGAVRWRPADHWRLSYAPVPYMKTSPRFATLPTNCGPFASRSTIQGWSNLSRRRLLSRAFRHSSRNTATT